MTRWARVLVTGMLVVGSLGWSGLQARAAEPPAAPEVSATYKGAPLTDCSGQTTCPKVVVFDDPVTFTFASTSPDVVRYRYGFFGSPVGEIDGATATIDLRPPTQGWTQVSVQAINSIGQLSETAYFLFNVGPPPGPVGSWTFDDGSGTTAADGSGNGQALTLHGGAFDAKGRLGGSLALDGVDDYAQASGPVVDTSQSFSIAAWVRPTSAAQLGAVAAVGGTTSSAVGLGYDPAVKRWVFARTSADVRSPQLYRATSAEAPVNGAWTHLLATYDAVAGQMTLYVNGRLQQTTSIPAAQAWNATGQLTIGQALYAGALGGAFGGSVDQLQIWQRVIRTEEVSALQDPRINGPIVSGLAARWPLDSAVNGRTSETVRGADLTVSGFGNNQAAAFVDDPERGRVLELTGRARQSLTLDRAVVDGSASFSVAAWVKVADLTKAGVIARQGTSTRDAWRLAYQPVDEFGGRFTFARANGDAATETLATIPVDVDLLQGWLLVAGTYNRTDGRIELTVNNRAFDGSLQSYSSPTRFGTTAVGTAPTFTGRLDELHVYAGILSQPRACTDYPGLPECGS